MDALTHAVEAFVGHWATAYTDRMALAAVGMIYDNLRVAYRKGKDLVAREQMALAATYAGLAFTRANVGYVHAIAHQLGGRYHTPHGLANAIMLPHVLRFLESGDHEEAGGAGGARQGRARKGSGRAVLAKKFLDSVEALNRDLGIPRHLDALREADIPGAGQGRLLGGRHQLSGAALHVAGHLRGPAAPGAAHRQRRRGPAKRAGEAPGPRAPPGR